MKGNFFSRLSIGYRFIPKTACTSIKNELYRIETGADYDEKKIGVHIHEHLRRNMLDDMAQADFRFIVVRDPVKRFLSAYSNRVVHHKELSEKYIQKHHPELIGKIKKFNPSLSEFIASFDEYMNVDTINHHFKPVVNFLHGKDLDFFTHVYKIEELYRLEEDLSLYSGDRVKFGREQTGGPKLKLNDLTRDELDVLFEYYNDDYRLLGDLYTKESILGVFLDGVRIGDNERITYPISNEKANESPFIIWTLRRSGGTNLGDALFSSSKFSAIEHEPFNGDRMLGHITKAWRKNENVEELRDNIKKVLVNKPLIKHCFEIMPDVLNKVLAEESQAAGYRHLFLYREYATDRLLSLNYSQMTGIWGKKHKDTVIVNKDVFNTPVEVDRLIQHEQQCRRKMLSSFNVLNELGAHPLCLTFESLYSGAFEYSKILAQHTFDLLGLGKKTPSEKKLKKMLRGGGQGTKDKYMVFPKAKELVDCSNQLGRLVLYNAPKINVVFTKYAKSVTCFEVWAPYVGVKENEFILSGAYLDEDVSLKKHSLALKTHQNELILFLTDLDSPKIKKRFQEVPCSENSRFISPPLTECGDIVMISNGVEKKLCSITIVEN